MTQWQAIVFTAEVIVICSLIVGLAVFLRAMSYEWQDRRQQDPDA